MLPVYEKEIMTLFPQTNDSLETVFIAFIAVQVIQ